MEAEAGRLALRRRPDDAAGRERQDRLRRLRAGASPTTCSKNGFKGVVFGLSGGIDSALCAAMAVDALGPERVRAVMLPYRFTSQDSLNDAASIAKALGIQYDILPIEKAVLGLEASIGAGVRRPRPATSPRRTSRPAPAA